MSWNWSLHSQFTACSAALGLSGQATPASRSAGGGANFAPAPKVATCSPPNSARLPSARPKQSPPPDKQTVMKIIATNDRPQELRAPLPSGASLAIACKRVPFPFWASGRIIAIAPLGSKSAGPLLRRLATCLRLKSIARRARDAPEQRARRQQRNGRHQFVYVLAAVVKPWPRSPECSPLQLPSLDFVALRVSLASGELRALHYGRRRRCRTHPK